MWIRHLIAVAALPFTVAVLIPIWLARRDDIRLSVAETPMMLLVQACGVASLAVGLTLFATSLRRFAVEGKGTLAPWDPPARLVLTGPYRYVRNPMISGVLFVLLAEALILRSRVHAEWFLVFLVVNAIYIPLLEEPMLVARFGEPYREYCRHIHRFWPRWHPWSPSGRGDSDGPPDGVAR